MNTPEIKTKNLILRQIKLSDAGAVFDVFSNDKVTEHYDCFSFTELKQAKEKVLWHVDNYQNPNSTVCAWAITLKEAPDVYIGSCSLHNIDTGNKKAELGYELHPDYWGKGLAFEAVSAVISFAFSQNSLMDLVRIGATTDVVSPKSTALLERLGFIEEGILRQYAFFKDQHHDVRMFSLLKSDV